jgi:hypothetical protein
MGRTAPALLNGSKHFQTWRRKVILRSITVLGFKPSLILEIGKWICNWKETLRTKERGHFQNESKRTKSPFFMEFNVTDSSKMKSNL